MENEILAMAAGRLLARCRAIGVLALVSSAPVFFVASSAMAAGYTAYVGCTRTADAAPAHACARGDEPGAFFETHEGEVEYKVCVDFPTGRELCAEEQSAAPETLLVNDITTNVLGTHNVSWYVDGQQVASWSFSLVPVAPRLTSASASAAFKAKILAESPSARFPRREGRFCPEIYSGSEGARSVCFAEYRVGHVWNLLGAGAATEGDRIAFSYFSRARWIRGWKRCRLPHAPGRLFSNNNCGHRQPETDAYFVADEVVPNIHFHHPLHSVGWQFTESAGFTSLGVYRAARKGHSYVFTNAVGDSFRYRP